jgi:hypothetical protein
VTAAIRCPSNALAVKQGLLPLNFPVAEHNDGGPLGNSASFSTALMARN